MQNRNNQQESFNTDSSSTTSESNEANKGRGAQGIDKAPGEETAQTTEQFAQDTQKGKKVDRDPSNPEEEPLNQ